MATYVQPTCEYVYKVSSLEKVVDGDTIDVTLDLGFAEVWVSEDGKWTNVNKWMCDNAYAVPYSGQNKKDVEALHELNRTKLRVRGEVA
jgi:endonuclease YncB( thermonuclease family)